MFNDEDLMNDALDAQIQGAIGRSRGDTLRGMVQAPGVEGLADDGMDEIQQQMIAEDEEEQRKKAEGGGGGLGGIIGQVGGMVGG